ncbi:hypothetical protein ROZALSC1DRAFT_23687 [Rozella allomycis CSF55]|uniref:Uncharacterized protein n=1 Tax=Rozella allomycis (strain CSF55) TaxID=988480 RepID=A0A4P9YI56_ROZAC|nr:hypothetical protein ROZALSC1DRAFT_23687 [Rozella allomycis CSF55]
MDILKEKKTKERDKDTMEGQTSTSVVNIKDAFKQKDAVTLQQKKVINPSILNNSPNKKREYSGNWNIGSLELVVPTPDQKLRISVVISDLTSHFYDKCDKGDTIVTAGELRVSGEKYFSVTPKHIYLRKADIPQITIRDAPAWLDDV